ncbi:MAG: cysteine methyltransferase [Nocardioides sp.]|nr:cysteine methyltransferase [Nocardioides sp.]
MGRLEEVLDDLLDLVEQVPRGRVTTYGALGDAVGCGPRLVGNAMARHGAAVPWWRVVRSDGSLPPSHRGEAVARYREEGTPLRRSGDAVDLARAYWQPPVAGPAPA